MSELLPYKEITYLSADGHTPVRAFLFLPPADVPVRGIVQLAHGMCEYVTRYTAWAQRFTAVGYVFCGNDHLGHGRTAPDAEELGYTAPSLGAEYLTEDLHTLTALMKRQFSNVPYILYGHSMGSLVARNALARYGSEFDAAILSGTVGPGKPTRFGLFLARKIAKKDGAHTRSRLLKKLCMDPYNRRFEKEDDPVAWLSRDRAVRDAYRADPLCNFFFTATGFETLFSLLIAVSRKDWAARVPTDLPILLISGDADPVSGFGRGVRRVADRLRRTGHNVTLKLYPGARHELQNEINRDEVFADLLSFLNSVPAIGQKEDTHGV